MLLPPAWMRRLKGWTLLGGIAAAALLAGSGGVRAADVVGRVTDAAGRPLQNVVVELLTSDGSVRKSATTNASGQYLLVNVEPGSYQLRCGERTQEVTVPIGLVRLNCQR